MSFISSHVPLQLISIHALREEGDGMTGEYTVEEMQFLSTPSARRATSTAGGHRRQA